MAADTRLHALRQRWEEARRRGQVLSADELCRDCPELRDAVRQQIDLWQLDVSGGRSSWQLPLDDTGTPHNAPSSPATRGGSLSGVLQAGVEPVPGYRLVAPLGQGGFGEVWKATGPGQVPVALKFLRLQCSGDRLETRALELMKQLRHPNLLTVAAYWRTETLLVIAVDLADGTLRDRLRQYRERGHPGIPLPELLDYLRDAARGIDYLNEPRHAVDGKTGVGVTHRDIKPANLLLVGGGVKVGDFGLAKLLENTIASSTAGAMTAAYTAPECIQRRVHRHSDQYSLAVTYCELRGGRWPFGGDAVQLMFGHLQLPPDLSMLPAAEQPVVARALAKDPEQRWPSCRAFVEALATAGEVPVTPAVGKIAEPRPRQVQPAHAVPQGLPQRVADRSPVPSPTVREKAPQGRLHLWLAGLMGVLVLACLPLLLVLLLLLARRADDAGPPPTADGNKTEAASKKEPFPVGPGQPAKKSEAAPADDKAAALALARKQAQAIEQQARELAEQKHDYAAAARLLATVSDDLRNAAFYREVCAKRDEVIQLDGNLTASLKARRWDAVRQDVDALLKLQPQRATDLQRLLAALPAEEKAQPLVPGAEFSARITRVQGNLVTFTKVGKKGDKPAEETTLPVTANVKVTRARFNKEDKKIEAGEALEGGLKNEAFTDGSALSRIVTSADGKWIMELRVFSFRKPVVEEFRARVTRVDGDKVWFKKAVSEPGTKTVYEDVERILPMTKNIKVVRGVYNSETKKYDPGDPVEGGLNNAVMTPKGYFLAWIVTIDGKTITEIRVVGGKKKKSD
jgi:serine/threonine protein kinase